MTVANDLIERVEHETGQRIDDDDSFAMAGLFGAVARLLGESSHEERDDVVAGVLVQHQMTPEYYREQRHRELLATLLRAGLSPDDACERVYRADDTDISDT